MDQLAGFTEDARKLALDRFRPLQPHVEDKRPLKSVAAAAGIPFRTAQRWASLHQQFGLAALARKKRNDSGDHRVVSVKIKEAIEGLALQKPPLRSPQSAAKSGVSLRTSARRHRATGWFIASLRLCPLI